MFSTGSKIVLLLNTILLVLPEACSGARQASGNPFISKLLSAPLKLIFHSPIKSSLPKNYQSLSASEKMNLLWENIMKDTTPQDGFAGGPQQLPVMLRNMNEMFDHEEDERPWKGKKLLHTSGPICKAEFKAPWFSPYTGVFKGCKNVLVRVSPGSKPSSTILPSVSAKFLIDGKPSVNYVAFRKWGNIRRAPESKIDLASECQYFGEHYHNITGSMKNGDMSNVPQPVPPPPRLFLGPKFATATAEVDHVGSADIAKVREDGSKVFFPRVPFEVIFRPTRKMTKYTFETMKNVPKGTKLFDVIAIGGDETGREKWIGSITSTSDMTLSKYGDTKLWFQHVRREADLKNLNLACPYAPATMRYPGSDDLGEFPVKPKILGIRIF